MSVVSRFVRFMHRPVQTAIPTARGRPYLQNKVTVIGAAGGIGQPLSLMFKLPVAESLVSHLALYDVAPVTPGVAADLSHISTRARVTGHVGEAQLAEALKDANLVIIPAGVPRKPGMTRDDLFNVNAGIVANVAKAAAQHAPKALFLIISNPVNSTVPIFAEVLKKHRVYDPKRVFGVTYLDVLRARTFVAENQKRNPAQVNVDVIGGHAGITILPLLSQVRDVKLSQQDIEALTQRIAFGGDEVVKAKGGAGSATLSMAQAGYFFAEKVLLAASGEEQTECAYVESSLSGDKDVPYFASPVVLGKNGIESIPPLAPLSPFEQQRLTALLPELKASIKNGVEFANKIH